MLYGGKGKERKGREGSSIHDVRLNGRFAPFAVLKGLKDVISEVEKGVGV